MNPPASELIPIGLAITAIGMSMVFAALALLWVLIRVITSVFADKEEPQPELSMAIEEADAADAQAALEAAEALTAERARVAAIVAGALLSNALPLLFEAPTGPTFEHGRSAPSWVTGNRARALQSWQPPRVSEGHQRGNQD
ncbi:MAG: OadG family protein [Anaerolineae bacterium]|nr:OadG family protein [Anaerolineae bacterium]